MKLTAGTAGLRHLCIGFTFQTIKLHIYIQSMAVIGSPGPVLDLTDIRLFAVIIVQFNCAKRYLTTEIRQLSALN